MATAFLQNPAQTTSLPPRQYHGLGNMSLNYKVSEASSTDPAYSEQSINTDHTYGASHGRGWVSRKFCDFPQTLTIRFEAPVRLKTLQFLCHETMISSRTELHFMPTDAVSTEQLTRIGHFEFQNSLPSQQNSIQPVRELKTVHFGATTRQLVVTMYGPFHHKDNIFHQIGLISLRCIGEVIGGAPAPEQQNPSRSIVEAPKTGRNLSMTPIRDIMERREQETKHIEQQFPPHYRNLLNQLRENRGGKEEGEQKFSLAEDVLVRQGKRLIRLMLLKKEAIDKEDYMTAKTIKQTIETMDKQVEQINGQTGDIPDDINPRVLILRHQRVFEPYKVKQKSAQEVYEDIQEHGQSAQELNTILNRINEDKKIVQNSSSALGLNQSDSSPAEQEGRDDFSEDRLNVQLYTDQDIDGMSQHGLPKPTGQQSKHNEDAVVPAHRRGVNMTFEEQMSLYDNQIKQGLDPSPNMNLFEEVKDADIPIGVNQYSGPLTNLFNADLVALLTSLKWQDRFQGLKNVTSSLSQFAGEAKFTETMNHLLGLSFDEKNTQICLQTILLINIILTSLPEFVFENSDGIVSFICDKGVESKIQLASTTSFELLCRHKSANLHDTTGLLATQQSFYNKATLNSPKQILFRLNLLHRASLDYEQIISERISDSAKPDYPLYEVQEMLKHSLQHPDRDVRQAATLILQHLYDKQGFSEIEAITMQLHPQILTLLKAKMPEIEKVILFQQKSKRVNNSSVYGSSGANGWPLTLKNRIPKAQSGSTAASTIGKHNSQRTLNYLKRKQLPTKNAQVVETDSQADQVGKAGDGDDDQESQSKTDPLGSDSDTTTETRNKLPNSDLVNLLTSNQTGGSKTAPGEDGGEQEQLICQFCGISQPDFTDAEKMDLHYVLQCQMLTNCAGCTQIIEVSSYTEHKLSQCNKKADFSQCPRCRMAIEADFFEQHVNRLQCIEDDQNMSRCPLCQKDLPIIETEEKAWKDHLLEERCPGANVRISTNAKARVSILRAKQPPASEVIMEEEDEEDDVDTVGGKTPRKEGGRTTQMSKMDMVSNEDAALKSVDEQLASPELMASPEKQLSPEQQKSATQPVSQN